MRILIVEVRRYDELPTEVQEGLRDRATATLREGGELSRRLQTRFMEELEKLGYPTDSITFTYKDGSNPGAVAVFGRIFGRTLVSLRDRLVDGSVRRLSERLLRHTTLVIARLPAYRVEKSMKLKYETDVPLNESQKEALNQFIELVQADLEANCSRLEELGRQLISEALSPEALDAMILAEGSEFFIDGQVYRSIYEHGVISSNAPMRKVA